MPAGDPSDTAFTPAPPPVENPQPPDPIFTQPLEELVAAGVLAPGVLGVTDVQEVPIEAIEAFVTTGADDYAPTPPAPVPDPGPPVLYPDVLLQVSKGWIRAAIGDGPMVAWRADQIVGMSTLEDEYGWVLAVVLAGGEAQVAGRWPDQGPADSALIQLSSILANGHDGSVHA